MKRPTAAPGSYGQILRSSSILGGSQALVYIASLARAKAAAVLLGPTGVGTLSIYQSIVTLLGTVSGLGICNSGVREIAEAHGGGENTAVRRVGGVVLRISWLCGALGWLLAAILAYPVSQITFEDKEHAGSIFWLGSCLLLGATGNSLATLLQGTRQVTKLAKFQVASVTLSSVAAASLFALLGHQGIVPAIIAGSAVNFALALWMGRGLFRDLPRIGWTAALRDSRHLFAMGLAFMWNAVSTGLVAFASRALVVRHDGLDSNGVFQASWAISGMFAGFVLQAMGTDFYPRLTAENGNHERMGRLINEQTEIGILLAAPGVLATLGLAPFLLEFLYSDRFVSGAPLICWFALGVFGQIVTWPMGFIQIAQGRSRAFLITQTLFNGAHLGLIAIFYSWKGIEGIAIAYPALYTLYAVAMKLYARKTIHFRWSGVVIRLVSAMGLVVAAGFSVAYFLSGPLSTIVGLVLAAASGVFCMRGLLHRLPEGHRLSRWLARIPFLSRTT